MADLHALVADPARFLNDANSNVRRLAVAACAAQMDDAIAAQLTGILKADDAPRVRAEAAEVLAVRGHSALNALLAATEDPSGIVREAVATGLGELENPAAVDWLLAAAAGDAEKLVREAAVAALGAIGDPRAVPVLLDLVASGPPQVRRRAVVALSVFDGPEVRQAIVAARDDRNPMVREAAEMVYGH